MPAEKKKQPNQRRERKRNLYPFPFNLTKRQVDCLDEIAREKSLRRSEVSRFAVEFYLRNYRAAELNERETSLERRIRSMEDHLQNLMLKCIRLSGQALYFSMLPYVSGTPQERIPEEVLQNHYVRSIEYAARFLKSTGEAGGRAEPEKTPGRNQSDLALVGQQPPAS